MPTQDTESVKGAAAQAIQRSLELLVCICFFFLRIVHIAHRVVFGHSVLSTYTCPNHRSNSNRLSVVVAVVVAVDVVVVVAVDVEVDGSVAAIGIVLFVGDCVSIAKIWTCTETALCCIHASISALPTSDWWSLGLSVG